MIAEQTLRAQPLQLEAETGSPVEIRQPERQTLPLIFSSPHSGADYPPDFIAASGLDLLTLRRSEDSFVDEIFAEAPTLGAPLLCARFPRAYCDPNREPYELDPAMFVDELPAFANTTSPRVAGGLGTIARLVASNTEIYRRKLRFAEAEARIEHCWRPYHRNLAELIATTRMRFGVAILIDCHSMPSIGGPLDRDAGRTRPDVVIGDRHGASCAPLLTEAAEQALREAGLAVRRNSPYAGGYNTLHYGRPREGVHALQIEINRGLYMDEDQIERRPGLARLTDQIGRFIRVLGELDPADLQPRR